MVDHTLELEDDIYQQTQRLAKHNKISLTELFNLLIHKESLSGQYVPNLSDVDVKPTKAQEQDLLAIDGLYGKYGQYGKRSEPMSIEKINVIAKEEFAKTNNFDLSDLLIGAVTQANGCDTTFTFDTNASKSPHFQLLI